MITPDADRQGLRLTFDENSLHLAAASKMIWRTRLLRLPPHGLLIDCLIMKVLIIAYSCSPNATSEPGLGWAIAEGMSRKHEVTLVVSPQSAEAVREHFGDAKLPLELLEVPRTRGRHHRSPLALLDYVDWQKSVIEKVRQAERTWDIAHQVTYYNAWRPNLSGRLPMPSVINAGQRSHYPARFYSFISFRARLQQIGRSTLVAVLGKCADLFFFKDITRVLATRPEHFSKNISCAVCPVNSLPESKAREIIHASTRASPSTQELRLISVGTPLAVKGVALSLHAVARLRSKIPRLRFDIVGGGGELEHLKKITQQLGIGDIVNFHGVLPFTQVQELLGLAHIYLHPSFTDTEATAIIEAMFSGLPVITLNSGGNHTMFPKEILPTVEVSSPDTTIENIAALIRRLHEDEGYRQKVGDQLRDHALNTRTREKVVERLAELYEEVLLTEELPTSPNGLLGRTRPKKPAHR
jgi:glycosyltransferase involved in cell wall biosynthesis